MTMVMAMVMVMVMAMVMWQLSLLIKNAATELPESMKKEKMAQATQATDEALRALEALLKKEDPQGQNWGVNMVATRDGEIKFMCAKHKALLDDLGNKGMTINEAFEKC